MMLVVMLYYFYVCFLLWFLVCLFVLWNIYCDFFLKCFFSFYIEIKVFSCDIYFVDNMGEIVCYLIGGCVFYGYYLFDVIVFIYMYVDMLLYIWWIFVFCDNMD